MRAPNAPHDALFTALRALPPLETVEDVVAAARTITALIVPGSTRVRFEQLAEVAAVDLALARITEGHLDALAILAQASATRHPGVYGVWAADAPIAHVTATREDGGWVLRGRKRYCSGAGWIDRALVTADGLLFDVELGAQGIEPIAGTWQAIGMATTESLDVVFDAVHGGQPIGAPDFYLDRTGFWHGAVGVAACWYGGALGAMRMLRERCSTAMTDHQAAHLGAVIAECELMRRALDDAAIEIDASTGSDPNGHWRALVVRHLIERGCQDVLERVGRAGGTSPLVFDRAHARRAADLVVYLRQHHGERDLAELGRLAVQR